MSLDRPNLRNQSPENEALNQIYRPWRGSSLHSLQVFRASIATEVLEIGKVMILKGMTIKKFCASRNVDLPTMPERGLSSLCIFSHFCCCFGSFCYCRYSLYPFVSDSHQPSSSTPPVASSPCSPQTRIFEAWISVPWDLISLLVSDIECCVRMHCSNALFWLVGIKSRSALYIAFSFRIIGLMSQ